MLYESTRGGATDRTFSDVLIEGLAPDGGLYLPTDLPTAPKTATDYAEMAARMTTPFVAPDPLADEMEEICARVYSGFRHPEVAPLRPLGNRRSLLELFWGPTLSFKDYALQLVGALFDRVLARKGERLLILGATSGDTGSAAIEACRGREGIDIVILYPDGAVSEVQRRQMTTVPDDNVHAVAVDGTFDDCQRLVKQGFGTLRDRFPLGAINSINWARVMAQTAYYAHAVARLGEPAHFVVPTGNFGNVYAGHVARQMGVPIESLTVANNANHGLADLVHSGRLSVTEVVPTLAPAMDIQVPSNLERYLYEAMDRDPDRIRALQERLVSEGSVELDSSTLERLQADFEAGFRTDEQVTATIRRVYEDHEVVLDPHTAIAWSVAEELPADAPVVVVSTAHPAKFPDAVAEATAKTPPLPADLQHLLTDDERIERIPADIDALEGLLGRISD